jgi:hypothetical protein
MAETDSGDAQDVTDEDDDAAERQAQRDRAERIRLRIAEATSGDAPPRSPREFTDRAATESEKDSASRSHEE